MSKNAKVKVSLDTRQAKADLRGVTKEGQAAAEGVSKSLGGGVGRAAVLGTVAGAGFGLAQRAAGRVTQAAGGLISEFGAPITNWLDQKLSGPEIRSSQYAREQTKAAYAEIIGRMKDPQVTPDVRNYFENVKGLREITERGNAAIEQELGGEAVAEAVEKITDEIKAGIDRMIDEIRGFVGSGK